MTSEREGVRGLFERAVPFLREAGEPYEDDGSNEPLELARSIEDFLASRPSDEGALSSASLAFDGGREASPCPHTRKEACALATPPADAEQRGTLVEDEYLALLDWLFKERGCDNDDPIYSTFLGFLPKTRTLAQQPDPKPEARGVVDAAMVRKALHYCPADLPSPEKWRWVANHLTAALTEARNG